MDILTYNLKGKSVNSFFTIPINSLVILIITAIFPKIFIIIINSFGIKLKALFPVKMFYLLMVEEV